MLGKSDVKPKLGVTSLEHDKVQLLHRISSIKTPLIYNISSMNVINVSPNCVLFCFMGRQLPNVENHWYKVCHRFRLTKLKDYKLILITF